MATKTCQPESHSPIHVCKTCDQPILPGPDMENEIKAGHHRACLKTSTSQSLKAATAYGLFLDAFAISSNAMGRLARETIIPLAKTFNDKNPHQQMEFIERAREMISAADIPDKEDALKKLHGISQEIKALLSGGAN